VKRATTSGEDPAVVFVLIVRRLLVIGPLLLAVSFLVFAIVDAFPGDACLLKHQKHASPELMASCRRAYNLDGPFLVRYGRFLGKAVKLDFGRSIFKDEDVGRVILQKLPATVELSACALVLAFFLGLWVGTRSALHPGSWLDAVGQVISMAGVSIPVFWLGMLLFSAFSVHLHWFDLGGWDASVIAPGVEYKTRFLLAESLLHLDFDAVGTALRTITLPAVALATIPLATITRMTRSAVLEEVGKDYVTTARAKGLSERRIISHHVRRNALIPIVTITGLQLGTLLSGAVLTETVFSWPGLGTHMVRAAGERDYPVIMGCMLLFVFIFIVVNLIVDLLYLWIDPRIRTGSR